MEVRNEYFECFFTILHYAIRRKPEDWCTLTCLPFPQRFLQPVRPDVLGRLAYSQLFASHADRLLKTEFYHYKAI